MRRLTKRTERGAVAVVVAFLMVPLIGFAALAIDVSSMWSQQQRLQVAADASALAIAQDCARNNCGQPLATAQTLTDANFGAGATAMVLTPSVSPTTGVVKVGATIVSHHLFAPVLGFDSHSVGAQSTATWGVPVGGTVALPLAFSWCEFKQQTGGGIPSNTTSYKIYSSKGSSTSCTGPSNLVVPGGFGWLDPNSGACGVTSIISTQLTSDPGASGPGACSTTFEKYLGQIVLLPIFDQSYLQGNNAWYRVYGYAAFKITGYQFPDVGTSTPDPGCQKCITGYFTKFVDLSDAFDQSTSGPNLGTQVVQLTS